jgi:hypothetical protein
VRCQCFVCPRSVNDPRSTTKGQLWWRWAVRPLQWSFEPWHCLSIVKNWWSGQSRSMWWVYLCKQRISKKGGGNNSLEHSNNGNTDHLVCDLPLGIIVEAATATATTTTNNNNNKTQRVKPKWEHTPTPVQVNCLLRIVTTASLAWRRAVRLRLMFNGESLVVVVAWMCHWYVVNARPPSLRLSDVSKVKPSHNPTRRGALRLMIGCNVARDKEGCNSTWVFWVGRGVRAASSCSSKPKKRPPRKTETN